jgi:formylglycine-generating enzyme required for sulfatase activity
MKALPAVLLFVLLLPPCLFGQSGKPQAIIVPTGSLGEVSEVRIKILEKTLESKLDDYFAIVPKDLFEEAQEQAFQEMESEECTEEQCIMMIREILQVENSFQLVLMVDGGDTQVSLTWNDLDEKRVEEEYCEGCKTKELRESVGGLVERLIKAGNAADVGGLSKTKTAQQQPTALRQKQESEAVWTEPVTGMKFVSVPGGSFYIGDQNNRKITIKPFLLGETEVTQAQWKKIMGSNPSKFKGDDRPVENVEWWDIQEFIKKLNSRTGEKFRLPTEAEWEYACREGGRKVRFCNGKDKASRLEINYGGSMTKPVASFAPNSLGLYDMSGNVYEWMCSEYEKTYNGSEERCNNKDQIGFFAKISLRGGAWNQREAQVRSSSRYHWRPGRNNAAVGFRLARGN